MVSPAAAGGALLLLQCSPQMEEMERFAAEVIAPMNRARNSSSAGGEPLQSARTA